MSAKKQSSFYVYLNSASCKKYFSSNTSTSFRILLSKPIYLQGYWEVGLIDADFPNLQPNYDPDFITINSHICEESISDDSLLPILCRIYKAELKRSQRPLRILQPVYIPINTENLSSIDMYLKDDSGNSPSFGKGSLICTLHFRQCEK